MRVIAVFFGPCAPDILTSHVSVFSHDFKRFDRFTKLATSSTQEPLVKDMDAHLGIKFLHILQEVGSIVKLATSYG